MGKNRRYCSERFLGSFEHEIHSNGTNESEFGEEDVWSIIDDASTSQWNYGDNGTNQNRSIQSNNNHDGQIHVGGLSLAFNESSNKKTQASRIVHKYHNQDSLSSQSHMTQSAPVNVPNWPKFLRVNSVESIHDSDDGTEDLDKVPPHEYLAREYARDRNHKMATSSVFEGVGRTLKGRDMSRVRDAVWSQTGFYG